MAWGIVNPKIIKSWSKQIKRSGKITDILVGGSSRKILYQKVSKWIKIRSITVKLINHPMVTIHIEWPLWTGSGFIFVRRRILHVTPHILRGSTLIDILLRSKIISSRFHWHIQCGKDKLKFQPHILLHLLTPTWIQTYHNWLVRFRVLLILPCLFQILKLYLVSFPIIFRIKTLPLHLRIRQRYDH